jgi:hypothetical protein
MSRYPLTALSRLRDQQVEDAAASCQVRQAQAEQAKSSLLRAELASRAHSDAAARVSQGEAERLALGELRAGDLVRHGAWAHVAALTTAALTKTETSGRMELHRAEDALNAARLDLAARKREVDVVAKHAERWTSAVAKRSEESEAAEVEDRWRSR